MCQALVFSRNFVSLYHLLCCTRAHAYAHATYVRTATRGRIEIPRDVDIGSYMTQFVIMFGSCWSILILFN